VAAGDSLRNTMHLAENNADQRPIAIFLRRISRKTTRRSALHKRIAGHPGAHGIQSEIS
jgi:hypothetical protein